MKRLLSLDILRGITVAGMILVNNPGSWGHIYAPLRHAEWNGLTPTDLVFPFFMFIMGFSMFISLRKYDFAPTQSTFRKILRRTVGIYLVGIFIGWFSHFCRSWYGADPSLSFWEQLGRAAWNVPSMRFTGVLARLAVCYGLGALVLVLMQHRRIPYLIAALLAGYFLLLIFGNGFCYGPENLLSVVDRAVVGPSHLYNDHGIDPEGLLSTLPSLAHVLLGSMVARLVLAADNLRDQMLRLLLVGAVLTMAGFLLSYGCPINKKIWSPTFVLATCGLASLLLGVLIYVVDVRGYVKWGRFFECFGCNALFLFVVSDVLAILFGAVHLPWDGELMSIHGIAYSQWYVPLFGPTGGSLAYALVFIMLNWCIAYPLYESKTYIKL